MCTIDACLDAGVARIAFQTEAPERSSAPQAASASPPPDGPAIAAPTLAARPRIVCRPNALAGAFPTAARVANIEHAFVRVRVAVDASGLIQSAEPTNDPGYGFAAAAVRIVTLYCRAIPARDAQGRAVSASLIFLVRFELAD